MDKQIITFSANEQNLVRIGGEYHYSSNKVSYIGAHFDLGANWDGFDSVRAVWFTDRINGISTVLDGEGNCTVPTEVLKKKDRVFVNLVGSIVSNGELTDRLTTYPAVALVVDSKAKVDSAETAPVTPSQFEQFVSIVQDAVANIKDIVSTTLNADYTLTFVYSDGTSYTTPSIRGERGPQGADGADGTDGNGIASAVLNSNYTLTLTFTDGTSYTTPSIRGAQGPKGDPGDVSQAQLDAAVSDLKSDLQALPAMGEINYNTVNGYLNAYGMVSPQDATALEVTTEKIPVSEGDVFYFTESLTATKTMWIAVGTYDSSNTFITRTVLVNGVNGTSFHETFVVPSGTAYVVFSYRTYGISTTSISLFENISNTYARLHDFDALDYTFGQQFAELEMGNMSIGNGWGYSSSTTRVRTRQGTTISLKKGDIISLKDYSTQRMYIGWTPDDGVTYGYAGWLQMDFVAPVDGDYVVLMTLVPEATTNVETFEKSLLIYHKSSTLYTLRNAKEWNRIGGNLLNLANIGNGYFETNGAISINSYGEKHGNDYIEVNAGETYKFICTTKALGVAWYRAIFYGGGTNVVGYTGTSYTAYLCDYYYNGLPYYVFEFTVPSGALKMRISWRAYGNEWAYLTKVGRYTSDDIDSIRRTIGNDANKGWVKGINHAGYSAVAPENTLPAFILSQKHGFKYVECDVRFTSDDVPVILHDNTINRTARNSDGTEISGTVYINNITYSDALTYDFGIYKGSAYAGTKIPSLEQFILLCKRLGLHPYIEIKNGATDAQIKIAVDIVKKYGMIDHVSWISFSDTILAYISTIHARARLGLVTSTLTSTEIALATALKNNSNEVFVDLNYTALSNTTAQLCVDANLPLEIWTLDEMSVLETINPYVSGVTSNRADAGAMLFGIGME